MTPDPMRTLGQRLYFPAFVVSLPVALVAWIIPWLGVPLALFWLAGPLWLWRPYRRAETGSMPDVALFLQRWNAFLRWAPWIYWFEILMWTALGIAGWIEDPKELTFHWFTPLALAGACWLLWRIFRVFEIPIHEEPDLVPVPRESEPVLWNEIDSIAKQLGVKPPGALAFDWWAADRIIFEPTRVHQAILPAPVLVLGGPGFEVYSRAELRAIIAHELAHLRHRDNHLIALHERASTWANWARYVGGSTSVGQDTVELWHLIADYPYGLDRHLNPLHQEIELACDRASAGITSPETAVRGLLKAHLLFPIPEDTALTWRAQFNADLDAEADSLHPTMSQRARALGVDQAKLHAEIEANPCDGSAADFLTHHATWHEAVLAQHAWRFTNDDEEDDGAD